jgi:predicted RND superfamily exporter protein
MNDRIATWLVERRLLLSAISLVLIVVMGVGLANLKFNSSYKIFFKDDNAQLLAHQKVQDTYTKTDNLMFVVEPLDKVVFSHATLASVESLTEQSWLLPYSSRVDSITNFQHTEVIDDDLMVANLVEDAEQLSLKEIADIKKIAQNEIALVHRLLSDRDHVTSINVSLNLPEESNAQGQATIELVAAARALRAQIQQENPNIKIHLQGLTIVNTAFNESAEYDSTYLFPVLFLLIIVMLLLLLRSFWSAMVTTVVIIVGVVMSQGFMGWMTYDLNQVNVMAPIIILTLAVCDCVHILASYLHHLSLRMDKKSAMIAAMKINLQPVFLTSITTAIGFLAMNASEVPPFKELGNIAAFGVMAAFFLSVTILPVLAIWFPMKAKPMEEGKGLWSSKLAEFTINKRGPLLWGVLIVAVGTTSLAALNELNDNTVAYFDETTEFRQASDFTQANLTGFDVISYSLDSGEAGGVNNPAFLHKVAAFSEWYLAQPEVVYSGSYTDTLKRLNKNMNNDDPAFYTIPESRELAAQYQLMYELSLPYGLDMNNSIDFEKRSTLLTVILKNQKAKGIIELDNRAQQWFKDNAPELATTGASISIMFAHVGKTNIESMLTGSAIAILLITLTLMLSLGSFKYGLLSILPNAFPALMAFGIWGALVGEVDLGIAVIFSLTLGIVVDDTVHFFSKYLRARKLLNKSPEDAVRYAFQTVAKPLVITTIVLVAGFSVLMLSHFTVNAKMGIMISATICIALIFDFLLLPALLMKFDKGDVLTPVDASGDKNNQSMGDTPLKMAVK